MRRWFVLLSITLMISACSALAGDTTTNDAQAEASPEANTGDALVNWNQDPLHIVFQADVLGGSRFGTFVDGNRVPLCTIYGDGRVVWLSGENNDVLFDILTPAEITDFVTYLTVEERFFTFRAGRDNLLPSPEMPITDVLLLQVNDVNHRTDSFGDWTEDYFERILEACTTLGDQPRLFQPSEGWFSVEIVSYNPSLPSVPWYVEQSGLDLTDVGEMPASSIWLENSLVPAIWTTIRENDGIIQFNQDGIDFLVVLHVPGVTVDSPPPPTGDDQTLATEEPESEG